MTGTSAANLIASMRYGPIYTPPTTESTLMMPNVGGGMNWGGGAFDPEQQYPGHAGGRVSVQDPSHPQ